MYALTTARWVALLLLRHPLVWLWTAILAGAWPAILAFTPLGLTTASQGEVAALYEIAFMALVVGSLAGSAVLQRGGWFLEPIAPGRRMLTELAALSAAAGLFLVAALLAPVGLSLFADGSGAAFRWDALPLRALLCHAHLAAIALVLLHLPLARSARLAALPVLVWALPALIGRDGVLGRIAHHVLAASRHLEAGESVLAGAVWNSTVLPIIGSMFAAYLLRRPTARHALRHPR